MMLEILVLAAAAQFIVLQLIDGREVHVNLSHIVSIAETKPDGTLTGKAQCIVSLVDAKFAAVMETCDSVRKRVDAMRGVE